MVTVGRLLFAQILRWLPAHPVRPSRRTTEPGSADTTPARTWVNIVVSLTFPPVSTTDSGRPWPSQAR